ncbi:MAG: UDP-N-acetylglucosamine 1-carboxyvinyltransferase, partial [Candidatus Parcubacteria bacterium]|nr:UDP-N-acetylglucosamine 1-carboxyvinyltransferase [Candidatus Parcubacteria bacterium]
MKYYQIIGGQPLKGEVTVSGSKNSVLKIIIASLLSNGKCILSNVPKIRDVEITLEMCQALGATYKWIKDDELEIDSTNLNAYTIPLEYRDKLRVPILFLGPLLHRFGQAEIPSPGGCNIGKRPVDFHIEGLKALGAEIEYADKFYSAKASNLKGACIELPFPSVGATENIMITATLAKGKTVIKNAAIEPEIEDLAIFLQAMGAIIYQDINRTWVIEGVGKLHSANYKIMPDRIEAASFGIAALVTGGDIYVKGANQGQMLAFLNWLRKAKGEFEVLEEGIRFFGGTQNLKAVALETDVHPGFMTDWQAPF